MLKKLFKPVSDFVLKKIRVKQLKKLETHLLHGSMFLKILNDEVGKLERHRRKRFIRALYKDFRLTDEIIDYCQLRSEHIIKTMTNQLKVYKKKKQVQRKENKGKVAEMKKGATQVKPTTKVKAEQTIVDGEIFKAGEKLPNKIQVPERKSKVIDMVKDELKNISKIKDVSKSIKEVDAISNKTIPTPEKPVDGAEFYANLKEKEKKGELPEQKEKKDGK